MSVWGRSPLAVAVGGIKIESISSLPFLTSRLFNRSSLRNQERKQTTILAAMKALSRLFLLFSLFRLGASYSHGPLTALPTVTPTPRLLTLTHRNETELQKRAITTELSTCGYLNGDSDLVRTANSGYVCRVDTKNALWGFCPNTVLAATDCGLAGSCFDKKDCSKGCGKTDSESLTTFTCTGTTYCSTALLTFGVDQTYSYIACGAKSGTDHYQITPNEEITTSTTSTSASESTTASVTSRQTADVSESTSDPTRSSTGSETQSKAASDESALETTSAASGDEPSSSGGASNNLGPIIGGVIGGLALVCGTAIAAIYLLRRNNNRSASSQPTDQDSHQAPPPPWVREGPKHPQELAGSTPQEMPPNGHYGREHAVELS
ncbi:hypothetical protein BGZ61DRAFT_446040, partial [Ilyonectria robusta]|uniref:uncharacterized protein n=1 Tax=Ilyonectria robusta TaxID=1079257 RepID=UPI001E8D1651